jgi:hypothetical protein
MRSTYRRIQKLEKRSINKPRFFLTRSKAEADACHRWIKETSPNWPEGSYWIIYDTMTPKEGYVREPEPAWGWGDG